MEVRRRVIISGYHDSRYMKPKLFFMADRMGLSGWIRNLDQQVLGLELQGDERLLNIYMQSVYQKLGITEEHVEMRLVGMDEENDGSVKIG